MCAVYFLMEKRKTLYIEKYRRIYSGWEITRERYKQNGRIHSQTLIILLALCVYTKKVSPKRIIYNDLVLYDYISRLGSTNTCLYVVCHTICGCVCNKLLIQTRKILFARRVFCYFYTKCFFRFLLVSRKYFFLCSLGTHMAYHTIEIPLLSKKNIY